MDVKDSATPRPYPWQFDQWAKFQHLAQSSRLPHAILLSGESETGKLDFARAAAAYILCRQPIPDMGHRSEQGPLMQACGECSSCSLLRSGSHPDLLLLQPEEPGKQLKIDLVRHLNSFSAARSHQGGWKMVLVEPAEALASCFNVEASDQPGVVR